PITAVRERPESLHIDNDTRYPALLLVTDSWYPGWRAWVDGEEFPVLRVNALFRGVSVAAGARRVEMHFDPLTFRVGTTATAAAALAIGFLLFVATVRTVRPLLRGITWLRPRER
ncbi:MAG: YfhO family protein, partial [Myxococcota bacterium]